jgi:hypothetical protein
MSLPSSLPTCRVHACARSILFRHGPTVATALKWAAGQRIPTVEWMQRLADRPRG